MVLFCEEFDQLRNVFAPTKGIIGVPLRNLSSESTAYAIASSWDVDLDDYVSRHSIRVQFPAHSSDRLLDVFVSLAHELTCPFRIHQLFHTRSRRADPTELAT